MKRFMVEKEIIRSTPLRYAIDSSGKQIGDAWEAGPDAEICLGYVVYTLDAEGRTESVNFYPVNTDTCDYTDNSDAVLQQIQQDFPATEWHNKDWE